MTARWLIIAALACTRGETAESVKPEAEVAAAQPQKEPSPADDVTIVTRWVEALRDNDQKELAGLTRYPFELHDPDGTCRDQAAPNAEALPNALACLTDDEDFIGLLRGHESSSIEPLSDIHLPAWGKNWHVTPTPNRVVTAAFARSDSRVELDIAIVDRGVQGVWKSGVAGSWAVKLASEWVDAVRHRNLERLEGVTAYPFELRDTRRGASCGNRRAKSRADLPKAVECLFRNDELQRAMTDIPTSGFIAYEPDSPLPDWIQRWWRDNEHKGFQRVMTMVATADGYEYNFQMLMASDGVRVVWKLGAFESRE